LRRGVAFGGRQSTAISRAFSSESTFDISGSFLV
jgi:hypothetical protein